ncbi:MAG: isoprenylcysteine carboxylmethyltransferase family protein [Cyanobacteria bacterium SBLK]|nr:isoprenylcysteine carboxylmethyltransferase family protein [Cyanobacteria bacterium SBLK]
MTITIVLAYILILCYFVMERSLRKGKQALNLKPGVADAGSSQVLWVSGIISILLVISAPILNAYQIGGVSYTTIGWLGLIAMLSGLAMRYWAAKTLGEFYTRTLQVIEGQKIVNRAPYNIIRHPGYLGTLLLEIGAGLAVTNWIVLLAAVVFGITSRAYRISVEEKMLEASFGGEYKMYLDKTWKLVPFLY